MTNAPSPEQNSGPQFVQVGIDVIRKLREMKLSGAEMHLYFYLLELDPFGDRLKELPTPKEMMLHLGIGKSTFYSAIARLQEEGLIQGIANIRPRCSGYVYLVQAEGTTKYKIGKAENIKSRLAALQSQSPYLLSLIHSIESDQPFKTESILHSDYKAYRLHGEWFELSQEHVAAIKQIDCTYEGEPLVSY